MSACFKHRFVIPALGPADRPSANASYRVSDEHPRCRFDGGHEVDLRRSALEVLDKIVPGPLVEIGLRGEPMVSPRQHEEVEGLARLDQRVGEMKQSCGLNILVEIADREE